MRFFIVASVAGNVLLLALLYALTGHQLYNGPQVAVFTTGGQRCSPICGQGPGF